MAYEDLKIRERAAIIRTGVRNGMTRLADIRAAYNNLADGGDLSTQEEAALSRANTVYSDYMHSKDVENDVFNKSVLFAKQSLQRLVDIGLLPQNTPTGASNCTLTATSWVDPNNTYNHAATIVSDPEKCGYTRIDAKDAVPGNLIIVENPQNGSYHTMVIDGVDKEGNPTVRYSTGGGNSFNLRIRKPLHKYHEDDNKQGGNHTEEMYFRYNYPNNLQESNIHSTGGPLYPFSFSKTPLPSVRY